METAKNKTTTIIFSIIILVLLASNIFIGYLYIHTNDSLNDKNQTLAEQSGKIQVLEKENKGLSGFKDKYNKAEQDNEILNQRLGDVTQENTDLNGKLDQAKSQKVTVQKAPKTNQASTQSVNNPPNAVGVGSTKDHVKSVMGTPSSISGVSNNYWWYGYTSWVKFDENTGLVNGWENGGNLKLQK